jgi:hypothetical protein
MFSPIQPLPAGLYQYTSPQDDPRNYRLHLRIEESGNGVLIVNGSTILHLNHTATEYAYYLIHNMPPHEVGKRMLKRYQIDQDQAVKDYLDFSDRLQILINTPDLDPVKYLDFERRQPYQGHILAPYRMDCAVTYKLNNGNLSNQGIEGRVSRELSKEEWFTIFDKAWQAGIPHIVFTGGEATLREDLPELIAHAEQNGQITGLLTDGLRFQEKDYLQRILMNGLDHMMIVLRPDREESWLALDNVIREDIFLVVHLTISPGNLESTQSIIHRLMNHGVKAVSLSTTSAELRNELNQARELLASLHLELIWNLPVPYSEINPIRLEIPDPPALAGKAWIYLEPDGDILPAQGVQKVLGNFLVDDWESIRKNLYL